MRGVKRKGKEGSPAESRNKGRDKQSWGGDDLFKNCDILPKRKIQARIETLDNAIGQAKG